MDWSLADRDVDLMVSIIARIIRRVVLKSFARSRLPQTTSGDAFVSTRLFAYYMAASYMVGDKLEDMQAAAARTWEQKCWCVRVNLLRLKQKRGGLGVK